MGAKAAFGMEPRIAEGVLFKMSTIGERSSVGKDSRVMNSAIGACCEIEERNLLRKAEIGDMTYTGADTSIMWCTVGKFCCISRMVDIGGNQHNYRAAAMTPTYRVRTFLEGRLARHPDEDMIAVGNDVWIGQGVSIARKPGLTVGDGAVIGSGAVVTKSVPPYAVVAGVPAKVLRFRFPEKVVEMLEEARWWDWPNEVIVREWDALSRDLDEEGAARLVDVARNMRGTSGGVDAV